MKVTNSENPEQGIAVAIACTTDRLVSLIGLPRVNIRNCEGVQSSRGYTFVSRRDDAGIYTSV
jgi:hypothetical protein